MPSVFAWVDFAEEDRRKMAEVINLFREQDTRDELGLGVIRDALADLMFPGTSTIQTRARYFLFIPWIYRRLEERGVARSEIARRARADEISLIKALQAGDESDGVIGIEKQVELQRLASSIYWAGLGVWRIKRFRGSQEQYHRAWESILQRYKSPLVDDDREPLDDSTLLTWDPDLPEPPPDFLSTAEFALRKNEAEYLQDRIRGLGPTLLGHLVSDGNLASDSDFAWAHSEVATFPQPLRNQLEHARFFSEAMHGAALLYNLLLAESRKSVGWIETYRQRMGSWTVLMIGREQAFQSWSRDSFWSLVESTQARVSLPTRRFVNDWLDLALGTSPAQLVEATRARNLVRDRERALKGARARIGNARALELWNGKSGSQQLNYRWPRARTIAGDVLRGLSA